MTHEPRHNVLTFPRSARYGNRRIATMYADWRDLTDAMTAGDHLAAQDAFDRCQEWIDWCFGTAAQQGVNLPEPAKKEG